MKNQTAILDRGGVITDLEALGRKVRDLAQPSHYSVEKHSWAKAFQEMLPHLRTAYAAIKYRGADLSKTLRWLETKLGASTEANRVTLLIRAATTGWPALEEGKGGWQVVENELVFVPSVRQLDKRERMLRYA